MTQSLTELLRDVEKALDAYERADQTTRTVLELTRAEEQVTPCAERLARVVGAHDVLARVGRPLARPDTRAQAKAMRAMADQARADTTLPSGHLRPIREIQHILDDAEDTAKGSWRDFVNERMPGLDGLGELARLLRQLGEDTGETDRLRRAASDLKALSRGLPDAVAPGTVTEKIQVIGETVNSLLGGSGKAADVRNFLEMVAGGGAPVRALTPAVTAWMRNSGTEGSFRIVLGSPVGE